MKDFVNRVITAAVKGPGGPETILLVEDDLVVREMTCDILCRSGYLVLPAESEQQALSILQRCPLIFYRISQERTLMAMPLKSPCARRL